MSTWCVLFAKGEGKSNYFMGGGGRGEGWTREWTGENQDLGYRWFTLMERKPVELKRQQ